MLSVFLQVPETSSILKFLQKAFGIDPNTSATIVITFLIFFLGYFLNGIVKSYSEYLVRKRRRRVFLGNLEQLTKVLKVREEILNDQLDFLEKVPNTVYSGGVYFHPIEVLREIGFQNSFESFLSGWENSISFPKFNRLRQKAFTKVWSIVGIIEYWDKNSKEEVHTFQNLLNEMNEKKIPSATQLKNSIEKYLVCRFDTPPSPHEIEFRTYLNIIIQNWKKYEVTTANLKKYYLEPIRNLTYKYRDIKIAVELFELCSDMFYWNNNMELQTIAFKQKLEALAWYIRYCRRTNIKIIKILM